MLIFRAGELDQLVKEVKGQLKKIAITASNRKDTMFLGVDVDRQGYISKENLKSLCEKQHLPSDPAIIDAVSDIQMIDKLVLNLQSHIYDMVIK